MSQITTFTVYASVTACDLEQSFSFNKTVKITGHVHFSIYVYCVCLSPVKFVHPTQPVEILGNVSTPFGTLIIH